MAKDKQNHTARLVRPKEHETCHKDVPFIVGANLSSSRMVLIDTGASYDMINRSLVEGRLPECVRDLIKPTNINTANGQAKVNMGVRIKTGPWDCVTDAILLNDSPNLNSVGQRVMNAGFSFIWVENCFPCLFHHVVV